MSTPRPAPAFARHADDTPEGYLEMARHSIALACETGDNTHLWAAVMQLRTAVALHQQETAGLARPLVRLAAHHWFDFASGLAYRGQADVRDIWVYSPPSDSKYILVEGDAGAALRRHLDRLAGAGGR